MLIPSPTSSEALGHLTVLPTFCIRRGFAAGGGGDEWPRRGNWHHRRAVSRGRRHIPDATICLGRPTDPTSRAHAFPGPMSFQTACSRSCPPQDRCVRRLAQSWPNHACQIRARVAWLMPSDRSEVRPHLPRRDLLTSPRAIDVQGAPQAPSPSSAKPMLAQRQGSAPARTPRSDPTICSRLSSHACLSTPPAPGPADHLGDRSQPNPKKLGASTRPKRCTLGRSCLSIP